MSAAPLRVLVCGSRTWLCAFVCPICNKPSGKPCFGKTGVHAARAGLAADRIRRDLVILPAGTVVIHGGAPGADNIADYIAREAGFVVERYPADWARDGKKAGSIRNQRMLVEGKPDRVYAFNLGTPGTADMMRRARVAGVEVIEISPSD